jgi:hypothetical protein
MKYKVEICETLQRVVEVEADDDQEAVDMVEEACNEDRICLGAEDFKQRDVQIYEEA